MYTKEYTGVPKQPFPRGRANRLPSLACDGLFECGKCFGRYTVCEADKKAGDRLPGL